MTATQICKAIDYDSERTETALHRMEETGQVLRNAVGRWTIGTTAVSQLNRRAATGNGKALSMANAVDGPDQAANR